MIDIEQIKRLNTHGDQEGRSSMKRKHFEKNKETKIFLKSVKKSLKPHKIFLTN